MEGKALPLSPIFSLILTITLVEFKEDQKSYATGNDEKNGIKIHEHVTLVFCETIRKEAESCIAKGRNRMKEGNEHGVINRSFTYPVKKIERHTHEFHRKCE